MRAVLLLALMFCSASFACNDSVPKISDPRRPVDASGKQIKPAEFLEKYCWGELVVKNESCARVLRARRIDSAGGEWPKF